MALAVVSGMGTLIDAVVAAVIAIRLFKPAKQDGFSLRSFRGSFFWFFAIFVPFVILMSGPLIFEDPVMSGYGYVIGHFFLYLSSAVYLFAPFNIIAPSKKALPVILSSLIVISAIPITIINWLAYANGDTVPVYSNGVALWNPPEIVGIYIPLVVGLTYLIFGFGMFLYHSITTKDRFLKRRSGLIAFGFLILSISGPLHDQTYDPDIAPIILGVADLLVALAFVFIAVAVFRKKKENLS